MSREGGIVLHRAPWLLPVSQPPLADGGLAIAANRICAVGPWKSLRREFANAPVQEYPGCCLLPGLVNAHLHSELSHLLALSSRPAASTFTGWIIDLLQERQSASANEENNHASARNVLASQWESGVLALADIGNTLLGLRAASGFPGLYFHFHEYLGLAAASAEASIKRLAGEPAHARCTGHAMYSTHILLLQSLKARANRLGHVFPLHVAESQAEELFANQGQGEFRNFLEQRGAWDGSFQPTGIDKKGSLQYLHGNGLLDQRTLCVHGVQVGPEDVASLAASGASVCLCPGSNQFLGVGTAPLPLYLNFGLLPALGTDSLASNPELSLWREMQLLSADHPDVDPERILAMATLGGARALAVESLCGSLEPGKTGSLLAVDLHGACRDGAQVTAHLVALGSQARPRWINDAGETHDTSLGR